MDVVQTWDLISQSNQLVVMGCKEGTTTDSSSDIFCDGPSNCKAIKGRCPTTNFIKKDQGTVCGAFENVGHLDHFHHEGRTSSLEVVADPYGWLAEATPLNDELNDLAELCAAYEALRANGLEHFEAAVRAIG